MPTRSLAGGEYPRALAWLGVLVGGLAAAGLLVYTVYRAFAGFFGQYSEPAG